ncbi:MAG: GNAT family N-acetyltransferase [Tolypothrix carrinoi HA7290-LM1]|jgi:GNAT superfamily N-acetyltransferase|nr:GNAT family N-acetyltransferase [Tolypothrix carrinoi HA7290-LM1]
MVAKIRPYELNDLEDTVQLWYRTWHQTFPEIQHPQPYPAWKTRFCDDLAVRGNVWVAEVENSIVGFVVVIKDEQCLHQLFVDSMYQNRGVGSVLLKKAKEICPQGLTLQTLQQNTKACVFYEKHGFKAGKLSTNKINGQPNVEYNWMP